MAFAAPVGKKEERDAGKIWPGKWVDATGYLTHYSLGYHTGADLNLNSPHFDADAHSTVYAMGDGIVTYAQLYSTQVWGKLIVINHGMVEGAHLFSRYAHVDTIHGAVQVGQPVVMGQEIGTVGNAEGLFPYHLHFDISTTDVLLNNPSHWPGENATQVRLHYVNPKLWLRARVPLQGQPVPAGSREWFVIAPIGVRVRRNPGISGVRVGSLPFGANVTLENATRDNDGYTWGHITDSVFSGKWLAMGKADGSEVYVSNIPPGP